MAESAPVTHYASKKPVKAVKSTPKPKPKKK
jgi:hypothetical protein